MLALEWLFIGAAAFFIGQTIIGLRILLAPWIGLALIAWGALTFSLFAPLAIYPLALAITATVFVSIAVYYGKTITLPSVAQMTGAAVVILFVTQFAGNLRPTPDTFEYHVPMIDWLRQHGTTFGMATINLRFGTITSIFPLTAAFPDLASVNGLIFCLLIGGVIWGVFKYDWFLAVGSLAAVCLSLGIGTYSTPTPDLAVMGFTLMMAWAMWRKENGLLVTLFACAAFDAKLGGIFVLPIALLYARSWRAVGIMIIATAPVFAVSAVATGCLLFPLAWTCPGFSWAPDPQDIAAYRDMLTFWSQWGGKVMPEGHVWWDWILAIPTIRSPHITDGIVFWPWLTSLIGLLAFIRRPTIWMWAMMGMGVIMFFLVPEMRYNFGLFITPMALLGEFVIEGVLAAFPMSSSSAIRSRAAGLYSRLGRK